MKKINIPFSPPDITDKEIEAVVEVLKSGWITTGPKTKEFEKKLALYSGTKKFVTMNSATMCMEMVLRLFGIGPGDEVITSAYTYTASASVVNHVGAKIVLVDTAPGSYQMDLSKLESAITEKTKAIIPVDIAGVMCDYDSIYEIVDNNRNIFTPQSGTLQEKLGRILILADAAHSLGSVYKGKKSGQAADFTCFSFHAVKNLTTAEGGAITWKNNHIFDDEDIYKEFLLLTLHGQNKDALAKNQLGAWEYDIVAPYFKGNMTDIHAAIGLSQLERYDEMLKSRKNIYIEYKNGLSDLQLEIIEHIGDDYFSSLHLMLVRFIDKSEEFRNKFIIKMAEKGIVCNVHYKPLPMMTAYKNLGFDINEFPNAYSQYRNQISLPIYSTLSMEEVNYIIKTFRQVYLDLK